MGRRRSHERRDLPPNLYIRNNGYYCYRDPRTGKEFGLGRDRRIAVTEAVQANIELFSSAERKSLTSRINNEDAMTMHAWLEKYDSIISVRGLRPKTLADYRSKIRAIKERFQDIPLSDITTRDIATILNDYVSEGKSATSKLIRSTLSDIFREAIAEGFIHSNPVTATRAAKSEVKRVRLTTDEFMKIYDAAGKQPPWVKLSMEIALLTGQRVSDICAMKWVDLSEGFLHVQQQKTGAKLAIPVTIKLDAANLSLSDTLKRCKSLSQGETIISSTRSEALSSGTVSRYFMRARKESGLSFSGEPPTFHEIRSLSARLYEKQYGERFAQHLLGHKSDSMAAQYRNDRGREWERIEIS
ncbi:tyrosine-type recombinase/integrase [Salmonella enterica]|nr:tyrosine-type recombinase/integrase [Salmonella enterica]